jgi:hypothetical protein
LASYKVKPNARVGFSIGEPLGVGRADDAPAAEALHDAYRRSALSTGKLADQEWVKDGEESNGGN